jgi:hypothetical protein
MSLISREDFKNLSARPREYKSLEIPNLGTVQIRKMTAGEKATYELSLYNNEGKKTPKTLRAFRQLLTIATVCNEEGQPIFTETDSELIGSLPFDTVEAIADKALEVNYHIQLPNLSGLMETLPPSDGK